VRTNLDATYPHLSRVVGSVLSMTLDQLASRAPCESEYPYFDLERLLWAVRDSSLFNDTTHPGNGDQVRGYLATFDQYVDRVKLKDPRDFVMKKLLAPSVALPEPPSAEMLDTLAECSWGLWLHDQYGNVEETRVLPGKDGDVDFYVDTSNGALWVDCMSLAPTSPRYDIPKYLVPRIRTKWREKFGARPLAAGLPSAIAVLLLKGQEHMASTLVRDEITGTTYQAPDDLWTGCPGLRAVWFGTPPWYASAHRPNVFTTWTRP
jgi:hypothetical protein